MRRLLALLLFLLVAAPLPTATPTQSQSMMTGVGAGPATSGCAFDTATCAVIAKMTALGSTPSAPFQAAMDTAIVCMKGTHGGTADVWTPLDVFYSHVAGDVIQASVNWKTPSANTITTPGVYGTDVIFTANLEIHSAGTGFANGYLQTNYTPGSGNFTVNSGGWGVFYDTTNSDTGSDIGDSSNRIQIRARSGTNSAAKLNCTTSTSTTTATTAPGMISGNFEVQAGPTLVQKDYLNGTSIETSSTCGTQAPGLPNAIEIMRSSGVTISTRHLMQTWGGASQGTNHAAMYACVHAFNQTIAGIP